MNEIVCRYNRILMVVFIGLTLFMSIYSVLIYCNMLENLDIYDSIVPTIMAFVFFYMALVAILGEFELNDKFILEKKPFKSIIITYDNIKSVEIYSNSIYILYNNRKVHIGKDMTNIDEAIIFIKKICNELKIPIKES